jgi:AcrR family transcriptional regulator
VFGATDPRMPRIDLRPRKAPRQQRSAATVAALLEAAARVLARDSLAGFNTNRVAEVAGVSVGSLYQYFPNKEALIGALIERAQSDLADALEALLGRCTGQPLAATLAEVAALAVGQQYGRPLLAAALDHEERRLPLGRRLREAEARLLGLVQRLLDERRAELDPALPPTAAADCLVLTKALVEADAERGRAPAADLQTRVVRALLGYLRPPPRAATRSGSRTRRARRSRPGTRRRPPRRWAA